MEVRKDDEVKGKIDYVGCVAAEFITFPYVIIVEAKSEWPNEGYCQLLAEMYAVMKRNSYARPLYGVLSNESDWQFYKLDPPDATKKDKVLLWHQSVKYTRTRDTEVILGILERMLDE